MMKVEESLADYKGEVMLCHRLPTMGGTNMIRNNVKLFHFKDQADELLAAIPGSIYNNVSSMEHDDMMGLTQALIRMSALSMGIVSMDAPLPVQPFSTIPFCGLMAVLARILDFGYLLSRDMIFENPFYEKWVQKLFDAMRRIESGEEDLEKLFKKLTLFLGPASMKEGSEAVAGMPSWWIEGR
jgi:prephenate dehydrogenase